MPTQPRGLISRAVNEFCRQELNRRIARRIVKGYPEGTDAYPFLQRHELDTRESSLCER